MPTHPWTSSVADSRLKDTRFDLTCPTAAHPLIPVPVCLLGLPATARDALRRATSHEASTCDGGCGDGRPPGQASNDTIAASSSHICITSNHPHCRETWLYGFISVLFLRRSLSHCPSVYASPPRDTGRARTDLLLIHPCSLLAQQLLVIFLRLSRHCVHYGK